MFPCASHEDAGPEGPVIVESMKRASGGGGAPEGDVIARCLVHVASAEAQLAQVRQELAAACGLAPPGAVWQAEAPRVEVVAPGSYDPPTRPGAVEPRRPGSSDPPTPDPPPPDPGPSGPPDYFMLDNELAAAAPVSDAWLPAEPQSQPEDARGPKDEEPPEEVEPEGEPQNPRRIGFKKSRTHTVNDLNVAFEGSADGMHWRQQATMAFANQGIHWQPLVGKSKLLVPILHPMASMRVAWVTLGILLVGYEVLTLPYVWAFEANLGAFGKGMSWLVGLYFGMDVVVHFFTGYMDKHGREVMIPLEIAKNLVGPGTSCRKILLTIL